MKFHIIALPLVAVTCVVLHTGEARNLNQGQSSRHARGTQVPFVIHVPDDPSKTLQTAYKRGITTVDIVRSVELTLNNSDRTSAGVISSESGDLLFSDTDSKDNGKGNSKQGASRKSKHNSEVKAEATLPLTSHENKDENGEHLWKYASKGGNGGNLIPDGLDFNSRILLGNVLIRKCNNQADYGKYGYMSDPKVSSNKYHATYINHNSSTSVSKSRLNVKFPPKMFPLKYVNTHQNRPNNTRTSSINSHRSEKSFYRSRIGKQAKVKQKNIKIQNIETEQNQSPPEETPANVTQTQNRREKLQALTHWDFGKKTSNNNSDENSYKPSSDISTEPSDLPHLINPTRNTQQQPEVTTPKAIIEEVIKRPVESQVLIQNAFTKHHTVPIYNNINGIQSLPVFPTANINNAQPNHVIHTHNAYVPHLFPKTQHQDFRTGSVTGAGIRTFGSETLSQNYIPAANAGHQHGVRSNWRAVYFVPRVASEQQQLPALLSIHSLDTGGVTQTIPVIIQQNAPHLYQAALVGGSPAAPAPEAPNRVLYEGKHYVTGCT
jgi:hypothetical protein